MHSADGQVAGAEHQVGLEERVRRVPLGRLAARRAHHHARLRHAQRDCAQLLRQVLREHTRLVPGRHQVPLRVRVQLGLGRHFHRGHRSHSPLRLLCRRQARRVPRAGRRGRQAHARERPRLDEGLVSHPLRALVHHQPMQARRAHQVRIISLTHTH